MRSELAPARQFGRVPRRQSLDMPPSGRHPPCGEHAADPGEQRLPLWSRLSACWSWLSSTEHRFAELFQWQRRRRQFGQRHMRQRIIARRIEGRVGEQPEPAEFDECGRPPIKVMRTEDMAKSPEVSAALSGSDVVRCNAAALRQAGAGRMISCELIVR